MANSDFLKPRSRNWPWMSGGELGSGGGAEFREFCAEGGQGFARGGDVAFEAREFFAAGLDLVQARRRLLAKGDDLIEGGAVFALERFEKRDALLELRELHRVDIERIGVMLERARDFLEFDHGVGMGLREGRRRRDRAFSSSRKWRWTSARPERSESSASERRWMMRDESSMRRRLFEATRVAGERGLPPRRAGGRRLRFRRPGGAGDRVSRSSEASLAESSAWLGHEAVERARIAPRKQRGHAAAPAKASSRSSCFSFESSDW